VTSFASQTPFFCFGKCGKKLDTFFWLLVSVGVARSHRNGKEVSGLQNYSMMARWSDEDLEIYHALK